MAFHVITGVGNQLELVKHKSWHDQHGIQKPGITDLDDASINDDIGVEQNQSFRAVDPAKLDVRNHHVEFVFTAQRNDGCQVGEHDIHHDLGNQLGLLIDKTKKHRVADEIAHHKPDEQAEGGSGETAKRKPFEELVQTNDRAAAGQADQHG